MAPGNHGLAWVDHVKHVIRNIFDAHVSPLLAAQLILPSKMGCSRSWQRLERDKDWREVQCKIHLFMAILTKEAYDLNTFPPQYATFRSI